MLAEELKRRGCASDELAARRLGTETTMTLDWIAQRLNMGAAGYAAQRLRRTRSVKKYADLRD